MNKYSYPAIFTPEENGAFSIHFPDMALGINFSQVLQEALMQKMLK